MSYENYVDVRNSYFGAPEIDLSTRQQIDASVDRLGLFQLASYL